MARWGDINAVLNRLVREDVVAGFWTNLGEPAPAFALHVIVRPPNPVGDQEASIIRERVQQALAHCAPEATVTVDRSGGETWPASSLGSRPGSRIPGAVSTHTELTLETVLPEFSAVNRDDST
jgi:hypothetical protein